MTTILEIVHGVHRIPVQVTFDGFRTLRISVRPEGVVSVRAPQGTPLAHIAARAQAKSVWIFRRLECFREVRQLTFPREYVSGETHKYLGRSYRLRVRQADRNDVRLAGRFFEVTTANPPHGSKVRELLDLWYLHRAHAVFERVLGEMCSRYGAHGICAPERITVRAMSSRWGSCSPVGTITLNRHLIKAPMRCLEYVLAHELCHLRHHGHTSDFYELLTTLMPDWRERRARLAMEPHQI